ncbi:hypothetical protein Q9Q99_10725 [Curtobacterium flaccumfaciens]|nr:hypothetical protein Q9Q99_10725 [Curtobacterium flaccumfaciens]
MTAAPTGGQYRLHHAGPDGVVEAVVTEVAAGIRELRVAGFDITEPFAVTEQPPGANGIVLAPWPNRVAGGVWELEGKRQQLDISEPKYGNASHGLLRFAPYRVVSQAETSIQQEATIHPQHGWPFTLETRAARARRRRHPCHARGHEPLGRPRTLRRRRAPVPACR